MEKDPRELQKFFDLGHQGEVDYTQIAQFLALTPTERLDRHEGWRQFMREALSRAEFRQRDNQPSESSRG